jgi:hypothetical protein
MYQNHGDFSRVNDGLRASTKDNLSSTALAIATHDHENGSQLLGRRKKHINCGPAITRQNMEFWA